MTEHCIIRADFSASRTVAGRKCLQLIFEVPIEAADDTMAKLGGFPQPGSNRWCAIALLNENARSRDALNLPEGEVGGVQLPAPLQSQAPEGGGSHKKPWSEYTRSQQSAIMCGDPSFAVYFGLGDDALPKDVTAKLKAHFRIESRAELDKPENHARWDEFVAIYQMRANHALGGQRPKHG